MFRKALFIGLQPLGQAPCRSFTTAKALIDFIKALML
jgi:hypothetical protein